MRSLLHRCGGAGPARLRACLGGAAVLAGMLLCASSAFAAEAPRFETRTLELEVHSTWVAACEQTRRGGLESK